MLSVKLLWDVAALHRQTVTHVPEPAAQQLQQKCIPRTPTTAHIKVGKGLQPQRQQCHDMSFYTQSKGFTLQCEPNAEPTAGEIAGVAAACSSCSLAQCGRMSSMPEEVMRRQPVNCQNNTAGLTSMQCCCGEVSRHTIEVEMLQGQRGQPVRWCR